MREISFEREGEPPRSPHEIWAWKLWLKAKSQEIGSWGKEYGTVGIGFVWETQTGLADMPMSELLGITRRLWRTMRAEGIIHPTASPVILGCRFTYIHTGDAKGIITLREE